MKKTLLFILLTLCFLCVSPKALSSTTTGTNWYVRTSGSDASNGGGFDPTVASPGTNFANQDAVQITYSDLLIGTPNTTATSVGHAFDSTIPGNVFKITSGVNFTVQYATCISVSGHV